MKSDELKERLPSHTWNAEIQWQLKVKAVECYALPQEATIVRYETPMHYYWNNNRWNAHYTEIEASFSAYKSNVLLPRIDLPLSQEESDKMPCPKALPGQRIKYASYIPKDGDPNYREETIKSVQIYNDRGYWTMAYVYANRRHGSIHTTNGTCYETMEVIG